MDTTGFSPSFDEMTAALSLKSKSGIHRLITALEERGFLRRRAHRARALEIIRLPSDSGPVGSQESAKGYKIDSQADRINDMFNTIPFFESVSAGIPNEIFDTYPNRFKISSHFNNDNSYAITVRGDSMTDLGILDGDIAIIDRSSNITSGDIAVVLVDEHEATLKRIRTRGNSVALEPANKNYETKIFHAKRILFLGKLSGILRQYC